MTWGSEGVVSAIAGIRLKLQLQRTQNNDQALILVLNLPRFSVQPFGFDS